MRKAVRGASGDAVMACAQAPTDRAAVSRARRRPGLLAALGVIGLILSACATTGMSDTASQGDAAPTRAEEAEASLPALLRAQRPGTGFMSPLATLGYFPLKLLPCSLGTVGSLIGFLFTFDARMVRDTVVLNCGGDWIITPGMLEGAELFQSVGRVEDQPVPSGPSPPPPTGVAPPIREPSSE